MFFVSLRRSVLKFSLSFSPPTGGLVAGLITHLENIKPRQFGTAMDGFVPCCLDVEPGVSCLLYGRMTVNPVGKKTLDAKRRKQQQQQQERRPPFLFFSLFLCPLARDCRFTYVNQPVKRLNVFTPSLGCLSYHRATSTYSPRLTIDSQTWLHTVRYGSGSTKPSRTQYLPVRVSPPLFLALFSHRRFFFPTVQDSFLLRLNEHFIVIILSALRE